MKYEIPLNGCAPTPLAHYLKALGILRLVAEQKDEDTAGRWEGERFVLRSTLDQAALERFFLEEYRPTPIVAPWNGGSGFYYQEEKLKEKDATTGKRIKTGVRNQPTAATRAVDDIYNSKTERFSDYRLVIAKVKRALTELHMKEAPKEDEKNEFVARLRGTLPDEFLFWFDTAFALSLERTPSGVSLQAKYPPLLGTAGNEGNLDFTSNFMQKLGELIDFDSGLPCSRSNEWLENALYGKAISQLGSGSIGQFHPGASGGPNATTGFDLDPKSAALINPWDYVLMLEGALVFSAATTRRFDAETTETPDGFGYPFTVAAIASGQGQTNAKDDDRSNSRPEMWLPIWTRFVNQDEIRALFSEGRITLKGKQARTGLDAARAIAAYGADRGIDSFQRYGFLKRRGDNFVATPLMRMPVVRNHQADLISDLDCNNWLESFRRISKDERSTNTIRRLARRLENHLFALTQSARREVLQEIISLVGEIDRAIATSTKARDAMRVPVPILTEAWAIAADDGSDEYRLACALAGLYVPGLPMRAHLVPVEAEGYGYKWNPKSRLCVWRSGALTNNLIRVIDRRLLEAERRRYDDKPFDGRARADLCAVMAFLYGTTDDARIARLVAGLACVRMPEHLPDRDAMPEFVPAAFDVLKPLFVCDGLLQWLRVLRADAKLPLPKQLVSLLRAGNDAHTQRAMDLAMRRLRIAGITVPANPRTVPSHGGLNAQRLLCALMIPMTAGDIARLCRRIVPTTDEQAA